MESNLVFKPLEEEFMGRASQKGWKFKRVDRIRDFAMYEKVDGESGRSYWEVVKIRRDKGGKFIMGGKEVEFEAKERYPSDEEFGVTGWCFATLDAAKTRYRELVEMV